MNFADFERMLAAPPPVRAPSPRAGKLNDKRLVILRMGLGRDSVAMMLLLSEGRSSWSTLSPDECVPSAPTR